MRDLSVAVRYMYTCTVIGEISNKKTRYTGFLSHHVIDILFSMKKDICFCYHCHGPSLRTFFFL